MTPTADLLNATLIARHDLTSGLSIVKIKPDAGEVPSFTAGQFCTLGLPAPAPVPATAEGGAPAAVEASGGRPRLVRRAYSIASPPKWRDHLELYIVLVEEGRLTPRLWTVEEGGRMFLDPKIRGEFTLDAIPPDSDILAISTGTGLAPFMSMLREYEGAGRWRRFILVHGTRLAEDLGYLHALERLTARDPSVHYLPVVSREPQGSSWTGLRGRVHSALEQETLARLGGGPIDPKTCHILLCGNPDMITTVQDEFVRRGFDPGDKDRPGHIHYERYW